MEQGEAGISDFQMINMDVVTMIRGRMTRTDVELVVALSDDEVFAKVVRERTMMPLAPIVRASTYQRIWKWQELWEFEAFLDDNRRAVLMRGCLGHMRKRRYEKVRGYYEEVWRRYSNRIQFTAFTAAEADVMRQRLDAHNERRHGGTYRLIDDVRVRTMRCSIYFNGEFLYVSFHERKRLMRAVESGDRNIRVEPYEASQRALENSKLEALTRTFKSMLKAPKDKQVAMAAELLQRENLTASR